MQCVYARIAWAVCHTTVYLVENVYICYHQHECFAITLTSWEHVKLRLDHYIEKPVFQSRQFQEQPPSLNQVVAGESVVYLDSHLLETVLDQEVYDVYSLPLFKPAFCDELGIYVGDVSKLGNDASLNMDSWATSD